MDSATDEQIVLHASQLNIAYTAHLFYAMKRDGCYIISYEELISALNAAAEYCCNCTPFDHRDRTFEVLRCNNLDVWKDMGARIATILMSSPEHIADKSSAPEIDLLDLFVHTFRAITDERVGAYNLQ